MRGGIPLFFLMVLVLASSSSLRAEEEQGQSKLDQAMEMKLSAESINQLAEVITLTNEALEAGLGDDNKSFAKQLLASTLIQRGIAYGEALLHASPEQIQTPRQYRQLRALALGDLRDAVDIDNNQPQAWFMIGRLESIPGGSREEAIKAYDKASELNPDDNLLKARILAGRATLLEDPEKQLADLNEAAKLSPHEIEVLRARGTLLLEQKRFAEAQADLEKAAQLEPDDAMNHFALGALYADQHKYDEALPHFNRAIELEPNSPSLYNQRARVHLLNGKPAEALNDLDKTLELAPNQPMALLLRANALLVLGDADRAMTDVERVLKQDNDFAPALRMRGLVLANAGKFKEAVQSLREAVTTAPEDVELRLQLAATELANKENDAAIQDFTKVIELEPENWAGLQGRADAYLAEGKHQDARTDYEAALKLQPKNSTVLNNLAWLLATSTFDELRNGAKAIELATEACVITEYKQAHVLSTLAAAYAETGDFDKAVEWSTKSIEAGDERQKAQLAKELESYHEKKPWRELIVQPLPSSEDEPADRTAPTADVPADQNGGEKKTAKTADQSEKEVTP